MATVAIDGKNLGRLVCNWPDGAKWQVPAVYDNLGPGQHTVVITVSPDQPDIYAGTTFNLDAFETPSTFVPTAGQQSWVNTFNQMRTSLGLAPVRLSIPLSMSAQAHADYMSQNSYGPQEFFGRTGYTGFFRPNRADYVGYNRPLTFVTESLSRNADPAAALADWNAGVYSRLYLVDTKSTEVGFGGSNAGSDMVVSKNILAADPPQRQIILCPADKQTNVPLVAVDEDNDPLPGAPRPLGFPISLHLYPAAGSGSDIVTTAASLKDGNGADVPMTLIWANTDKKQQIRDKNHYYMVPSQALNANTTYTARVTGVDDRNVKFDVTWTFTTAGGTAPAPPPGTATFLAADTNTSGSWQGTYGTEGSYIVGESTNIPAYVTINPLGMQNFVWNNSTSDPRAPQKAVTPNDRISACWYTADNMTIELRFNDGNPHAFALYMLDWDGFGGGRAQTVDILDSTNRVIDTRTVTGFGNGQYLVWNLSGFVKVRVTNNNPAGNAVVQAMFFK